MKTFGREEFIKLLQISGSNFPVGSFSHSYGLETYTTDSKISKGDDFLVFAKSTLQSVISGCDAPAVSLAYDFVSSGSYEDLFSLDSSVTALKLSRESREASAKTGRAFLRLAAAMFPDDRFIQEYFTSAKKSDGNYPVAFGTVCARLGAEKGFSVSAYIFGAVNSLVQAGIKLIPLGSAESQRIILALYPDMLESVEMALERKIDELGGFSPGLDIASMRHERLYTRLYMS